VTNTYNVAGSYTVTLTVYGPGGSNSYTVANYIVTSSTPKLGALTMSGGKLIFSGSNCPVGVQYRILSSTNVSTQLANWIPVTTNTFNSSGNFAYTNSIGSTNSFFIMVSP
jgi:PKD repeat protein